MDLMNKLASLAQRYEELNTLMAQPEVLDDIPPTERLSLGKLISQVEHRRGLIHKLEP